MKTTQLKFGIVSTLAIVGSLLFYEQYVGLNVLVYTSISLLFLLYLHPTRSHKEILKSALVPVGCGVFLALYPQILTFWLWMLSYVMMWSKATHPYNFILIPFHGWLSQLKSPWLDLANFLKIKQDKLDQSKEASGAIHKAWIYLISIGIALIFALMYASSNPIISQFIGEINFSYFEIGWFFLTGFFFMATYGLVFFKKSEWIEKLNTKPNTIAPTESTAKDSMMYTLAKITLWVLIVLITIVNLVDLSVIFTGDLPEGMTHSSYVHQGFNTLIFSLSLAVAIILYFFKSQINFHPAIKTLKTLSVVWVGQNILLALITAYKNLLYVETYGLTYLRIAVFFGLICTLIALLLAYKKVREIKSNWFYLNELSKYAFMALFLLCLIPIDFVITRYNIHYAQEKDITYLRDLDHPDVKLLLEHQRKYHPAQPWFGMGILQSKLFGYQDTYQQKPWPSYCWYYESLKDVEPY